MPPGNTQTPPGRSADVVFSPTDTFVESPPDWTFVPGAPSVLQSRDAGLTVVGQGLYGVELTDLQDLAAGDAHGGFGTHYGRVADGTGPAALNRLLTTDGDDGERVVIRRWAATPPTVHVANGATAAQFGQVRIMIGLINSALPRDWQLRLSADRIETSALNGPEQGRIIVEFTEPRTWPAGAHRAVVYAQTMWSSAAPDSYIGARVFVDPATDRREGVQLLVLAHELLHSLGREHADPAVFPDTVLHAVTNAVHDLPAPPILYRMDNEAQLAAYGFLAAGQDHTTVATALGPWETESNHFVAETSFGVDGVLRFGASERNGHVRPWAVGGPLPDAPLTSNALLSGSASWAGRLAGLTPASNAVAGAAEMTVELAGLTGSLAFSALEFWAPGATPGAAGSGMRWGGGDLQYGIRVTANAFSRTSGDDGEVNGAFVGAGHEGMIGPLMRDDLSAGFGGVRE